MPANTAPIYTKSADVSTNGTSAMAPVLTAAAADYSGVAAANALIHTAGANGSYVRKLRLKAVSTNVATVLRLYLNNGSSNAVAANNALIGEVTLPATTASAVNSTPDIDYPLEFALPAGFRLYAGLSAAVAGGWVCTAIAGQY
jgi:hypothetical protein